MLPGGLVLLVCSGVFFSAMLFLFGVAAGDSITWSCGSVLLLLIM
jgi:hypothetical protein